MAATSWSRLAEPTRPPSDRGKNSYQAPMAARSRSTHRGQEGEATRSDGRCGPTIRAVTAGCSACSNRSRCSRAGSRRASTATASSGSSRPSSKRAPSSSSMATSWPASSFFSVPSSQVHHRSTHASTTSSWAPMRSGRTTASHRSLPRAVRSAAAQLASSTWRQRTRPARRSWPSVTRSHVTSSSSPTTALAGAPLGVEGRTSSMAMRPRGITPFGIPR